MSIVINARFVARRVTGVERYGREVARRLGEGARWVAPSARWPGWAGHVWEQFFLPGAVRGGEVLWSPANTGPLRVRNQVVTIHDLAVLDHPEWFRPGFVLWYRVMWPLLARRVRRIITVSAFSAARIRARLGVAAERVVVISNGVDTARFRPAARAQVARVRRKYALEGAYLLFVGSLQPRKNLSRLLAAWERVRRAVADVALVLAGVPGPVFRRQPLGAVPGVRVVGYVPDADLPALYSAALGLVQPSLYEGSALTALEALACGCPVLCSNIPALAEVVADAGLLFDPRDTAGMAGALLAFLRDGELQEKMRRAGRPRAQRFSWDTTARQVSNLLHEI